MQMQRPGYGTRKIPALATLISLFEGSAALLGLLSLLHLYQSPYLYVAQQQSIAYKLFGGASEVCLLLGAIFLWKMKRDAGKLLLAGFLCSLCAIPFFHTVPGHLRNLGLLAAGIVLQVAITAYVWWVTANWQKTRLTGVPLS